MTSAAFSPDGRQVVTASTDHTARVWSIDTGKRIAVLSEDFDVNSVAYSPDGTRIITASGDFVGAVRIWNARAERWAAPRLDSPRNAHLHRPTTIRATPDGRTPWEEFKSKLGAVHLPQGQ